MTSTTPAPGIWLLETKLHPPMSRGDIIRRPRLEEALRLSVATRAVTLLSAPAGYGKTTLLATLPRLLPDHHLAWVSLDEEDNDPVQFLGVLATALQRLHPDCGRSAWLWLAGGGSSPEADSSIRLRRAVGALINDMLQHLTQPVMLVLDDLHRITEPGVYLALEYLLDHQPPGLRLVIGTRHDPPLRLARLAGRRQLTELRRLDLQFTADEAEHLLNGTLGLGIAGEELQALQERTEGWPVGLCLLATTLERLEAGAGRAELLAGMTQSERYVFDFLAEEVLEATAPELRRFLLQSAILAELSPIACRAVSGREDAGELLEELYRRNLLIAVGGERGGEVAYRYHALFTEFLRRQLERETDDAALADLHRRAAEVQATPGRAIAHYLAAGLWGDAARVMERAALDLLYRGMAETVRHWFRALPDAVRAARPRLLLLMGRCEIHRGDYGAAAPWLMQAQERFAAADDGDGEGEALSSLMTVRINANDFDRVAALVERAKALPLRPQGEASLHMAKVWLRLVEGRLEEAATEFQAALAVSVAAASTPAAMATITYMSLAFAQLPGWMEPLERFCAEASTFAQPDSPMRLGLDELIAGLHLSRGRLDEALASARAAEDLRGRLGGYPVLGADVVAVLATIHTATGEQEAATAAVERLLQRLDGAAGCKRPLYLHAAARILCLLDRVDEARRLHDRLCAQSGGLNQSLGPVLQAHLGGLLALKEGRHAEAAELLKAAAAREAEQPLLAAGGSSRLLLAQLHLAQGRPDEAAAEVDEVLAAWESAGQPGRALLDGPAALEALRLAAARGSGPAGRILRLMGQEEASPAAKAAPTAVLPEPLSPREEDVLRLIVEGMTNRQIGQQLFISEETVKSHVVRILRKLDVTSRTQAAIRGREIGYGSP